MEAELLLLVLTGCFLRLCVSERCAEELAQLQEREAFLKKQLQTQEVLIQGFQQRNREHNRDKIDADRSYDNGSADCAELFTSGSRASGVYRVKPAGSPAPVSVFCDMSDGGGWTVVQRRVDGAETFNRSWAEYKDGFGDLESDLGEFWLGNENLHHISSQGNYSLRIHLQDFQGHQRYAEYQNVRVASEEDDYRLDFGSYAGTAGDALSGSFQSGVTEWAGHRGMKFSTFDKDNDNYRGNCAQEDSGGWWFNKCHSAHLNGKYYPEGYYNAVTDDGVVWYPWRGWWYSLKTSIMKLRPTSFKMTATDDPNAVQRSTVS